MMSTAIESILYSTLKHAPVQIYIRSTTSSETKRNNFDGKTGEVGEKSFSVLSTLNNNTAALIHCTVRTAIEMRNGKFVSQSTTQFRSV